MRPTRIELGTFGLKGRASSAWQAGLPRLCDRNATNSEASSIISPTTRQDPQNDDHLILVIEAEANAPVANAKAPLDRVELPNVATTRGGDEPIKGIENPALNRRIKSL